MNYKKKIFLLDSNILLEERNYKERSLSPLSKKMAIHRAAIETGQKPQGQFNQPFFQANKTAINYPVIPNEFKVS